MNPPKIGLRVRLGILATLLAGAAACGDSTPVVDNENIAVEEVPEISRDGDWIRLDGTVVSTTPSSFILDYGDDNITVEADDWDIAKEGLSLLAGDRVSVTGRVDNNVFASDTVEASAIYLHNLNTVYFANSADEEEFGLAAIPSDSTFEGVDYTGWVTGTSDTGFTLGAGVAKIDVVTSALETPLAKDGIEAGDR